MVRLISETERKEKGARDVYSGLVGLRSVFPEYRTSLSYLRGAAERVLRAPPLVLLSVLSVSYTYSIAKKHADRLNFRLDFIRGYRVFRADPAPRITLHIGS